MTASEISGGSAWWKKAQGRDEADNLIPVKNINC
jgi:hypothetical protein